MIRLRINCRCEEWNDEAIYKHRDCFANACNDSSQIIVEELSMKKQDGFTLFVIPAKAGIQPYFMLALMKEFPL